MLTLNKIFCLDEFSNVKIYIFDRYGEFCKEINVAKG